MLGTLLIQMGFGVELLVSAMEAAVVNEQRRAGISTNNGRPLLSLCLVVEKTRESCIICKDFSLKGSAPYHSLLIDQLSQGGGSACLTGIKVAQDFAYIANKVNKTLVRKKVILRWLHATQLDVRFCLLQYVFLQADFQLYHIHPEYRTNTRCTKLFQERTYIYEIVNASTSFGVLPEQIKFFFSSSAFKTFEARNTRPVRFSR
jgi:hypothetical protein